MEIEERILLAACKGKCGKLINETCPYSLSEKQFCPLVKEVLDSIDK